MSDLPTKTTAVIVKSFPKEELSEDNFEIEERPVHKVKDGHILIKTLVISVDPYLRFRMGESKYGGCYKIGEPASGWAVGEVLDTADPRFKIGDTVLSYQVPWCMYANVEAKTAMKTRDDLNAEEALGVCGMPAMTAFFGMEMAEPKQGETIVVSGGAGAVGSTVGQIAKMKGMKVIGIAGSAEKVKVMMDEFGFDEGINYKEVKDMKEALKKSCPNGIDVYWDNVGGETLEAAAHNMNKHTGRIASCGSISNYQKHNDKASSADQIAETKGVKILHVAVFDNKPRWGEAIDKLAEWYKAGKLKKKTTIYKGIQNVPRAFVDLFAGKNIGKMLIDVTI